MSHEPDRIMATTKVEFVMEFPSGPWGIECDMAQVIRQAHREAEQAANAVLRTLREGHPASQNAGRLLRVSKIGGVSIHTPKALVEPSNQRLNRGVGQ